MQVENSSNNNFEMPNVHVYTNVFVDMLYNTAMVWIYVGGFAKALYEDHGDHLVAFYIELCVIHVK